MLTLAQESQPPRTSLPDADSLTHDYLEFDRHRTLRRQYTKAFGGMALLVMLGALFGRVQTREASIVAGLLVSPPLVLGTIEAVRWQRLVRRLDRVRDAAHRTRKL